MSTLTAKSSHVSQPERFCKYIHRYCNQTRLDGFDYCIRHILEDKTAPFRQCMYVNQPNKKRCTNAAPKTDKNDRRDNVLCPFHAKRAMMKTKVFHPKKKPVPENPATLLKNLEHYCEDPVHDPNYRRDPGHYDRPIAAGMEGGKPSTIEQVEEMVINDGEPILSKAHVESVDDDFCFNDNSSYLDHAGVYTHKEICAMTREKLLKLQHLYCVELKVLYHDFKEARRRYLKMARNPFPEAQQSSKLVYRDLKEVRGRLVAKIEKPASEPADIGTTSSLVKKIHQSLQHYHQRSGIERIFRRRVLERRAGIPRPVRPFCAYEVNGLKCTGIAMMATQFCKNHILNDPNQVLFVPCHKSKCTRPVLPFEETPACDLHFTFSSSHAVMEMEEQVIETAPEPEEVIEEPVASTSTSVPSASDLLLEPEHFQSMDDIASLGLDAIGPCSLFGLDQFGEPGESTDTGMSADQSDLMHIPAITLHPPADILSDSRKSESDEMDEN
ncbi:hypothetical protein JTE90_020418 [Oedothorax gibbosus]|uniref:KAT8 regulatory NSL complex subunit 2 n=1 Tax=Oedothorax gibbosus TaxID=931172 RepID=A0AAV6UFQ1_9ARAC|nr:hypothetical protein JTE90_020418 [Oedothorax gibbosus]